ncbi:Uncharacterized protein OS=Planctomyces limnophilus (strain ATCC 43296 / DSM 3776 / IFAM 1008 / 290) GN=Plim_1146 PE=4 SV=1: Prenyltrans_2 [Gemmataceae bacterium]|nr:Uncharacterized protein OS=Planctomyces limnophilus (strain ATCC 43296 / DSM 3776 / IFAM 1008 / 290) GN=Plim_1146 PE=4 SV=1: Prenyltrans_2 [Gemmataceae bacterium]VTT96928.1 Uncharacterized protein OS=Planctomyces limnophilus (strain ATCC 43296 / DSM 3776 / IFAM 1008 / 290) GN=Plim_1146 PE=4 SV=1: Prenyltrans_2 [Gemmataceae bacterium]
MIPRVVLVLLLALAAVTAYCARHGGDAPPGVEKSESFDEESGLREDHAGSSVEAATDLRPEEPLLPCGDLCCAVPSYEQLLLQYLVESYPGNPDDHPPDLTDSQSRWVRIPEIRVIATATQPPNLDEHSSLRTNYVGRSGATRRRLLEDTGGSVESERAVWRGLAWLARHQRADGSWQFDAGEHPDRVGATALALLAFLGAGETHLRGTHKAVVAAGLDYILDKRPRQQVGALRLSSDPFAHALGTIALCEAVGMTQDRAWLLAAAQSAVNHIVVTQTPNGSWAAAPGERGDITLVGWQVQALKAAAMSKAVTVPAATFKKAVDFLNLAGVGTRKPVYGPFGKAWAFPGTTWTASGLLCRYLIDGWGPDQAGMMQGVGGLMPRAPVAAPKRIDDAYFLYHATQVVRYCEGDEWATRNRGPKVLGIRTGGTRDWLVGLQAKTGDDAGSFDPDDAWAGKHLGRLGTTAFAILTLEVYYRHLPLYKRAIPGALSGLDGK